MESGSGVCYYLEYLRLSLENNRRVYMCLGVLAGLGHNIKPIASTTYAPFVGLSLKSRYTVQRIATLM